MRTTPVVLVTGVSPDAMASATITLQWDLPDAVVVHHRIDVARSRLLRTVSEVTGVVESEEIDLEHACVSCAVREDVVPTLARLAQAGRWGVIVAQLPAGAEAQQVCRVVAGDARLRHVRVAGVLCAVDGERLVDDLLGDELLCERGTHTAADDRRGVAEVGAAQVEYADAVTVVGAAGEAELELVRALARPGVAVLGDGEALAPVRLLAGIHGHAAAEEWTAQVRREPLPALDGEHVWRLDLRSDRPFHPDRLYGDIVAVGGGPRRSRGCFWLPTRATVACAWDGAGGQLSIGVAEPWGHRRPFTRIVVTGMDDGRDDIAAAFEHCLLTDDEIRSRGRYWEAAGDGFDAWLGDIHSPL
ncbi:cobalamin biosynthesis protein CobW [Jiangella aurantiaca]|uniref:Cobalamin biosynthesis protein CobW n=1 Tax=Jiangella aurantiaca TaxID=2530373 RepID=A0A4R5A6A3_9ACTN|nr:GTP-binding protein [Jiangella aurantiaca]TDD66526.1 cobalamin biosynthesis protein CobW [Jiangella aurantiaca]